MVQIFNSKRYHVPLKDRSRLFFLPTRLFFDFLEKVHILNSDLHKIHHKHRLLNCEEVERFQDMWTPQPLVKATDAWWDWLLWNKYETGKKEMAKFLLKIMPAVYSGAMVLCFICLRLSLMLFYKSVYGSFSAQSDTLAAHFDHAKTTSIFNIPTSKADIGSYLIENNQTLWFIAAYFALHKIFVTTYWKPEKRLYSLENLRGSFKKPNLE